MARDISVLFKKLRNKRSNTLIFLGVFSMFLMVLTALILISSAVSVAAFIITEGFIYKDNQIPELITNAISNLIVALAIYELQRALSHELRKPAIGEVTHVLRRSTPRFIVVVCVALALEGLIFVIKFGQTGQPQLLLYPALIILSAALLLVCLGIFLRVAPEETVGQHMLEDVKEQPETKVVGGHAPTD
ncbi:MULTISPECIES: hypothetical protein [Microbulbifer]|uniref:hypothetical protein n=1 Tax=Microbulbifer TaxID=48073 RepID=UPI001E4A0EC8|nr:MULTISPECIES: hypothetical protein [Microbulbifer]UHQ55504.1 hypothetical protein LVE68_00505 [Microbulbifer sp. YPW16]